MRHAASDKLAEWLRHELVRYMAVAGYLYICFGAILFYKTSFLRSHGISYVPYGVALVKALFLGKFILIGQAFNLERHGKRSRPFINILINAMIFLVFLVFLSIVEEVVVGLFHEHTIRDSLADVLHRGAIQAVATSLLILLILIPYFAFHEIELTLGEGKLLKLLSARREHPVLLVSAGDHQARLIE